MAHDSEYMSMAPDDFLNETSGSPSLDKNYISKTVTGAYGKSLEKALTQWRKNGHGFVVSGPTTQALSPGIYGFEIINEILSVTPQPIKSDKLIRFPDSKSDEVINDTNNFWKLSERYKTYGLSHKRAYLLHGPQGSGKTSTIAFVCNSHVEAGGVVFIWDASIHPALISSFLVNARRIEPERNFMVILEDIDSIIKMHGDHDILAALDGQKSINKVVFIATTNYIGTIEPRIKNRPSRFDRVLRIDPPNLESRKLYLKSRLTLTEDELNSWAKDTEGFSVAHLKELIVSVFCYDQPYKTALQTLKDMFKATKDASLEENSAGFSPRR